MKHFRNTIRTRVARQLAIAGALVLALTLVGSCSNMITDLTAGGDAGQESTAVTGVSVSPTSASIVSGDTQQLTATVSPTDASDTSVTWSSSDDAVATVDSSGVVTGAGAGTATITVTTTDGGETAEASITVSEAPFTISGTTVDGDGTAIATSTDNFTSAGFPLDLDVDQSNDLWGVAIGTGGGVTQYDISDPDNPAGTTFRDGSGGDRVLAFGDGVLAIAQGFDASVKVWGSGNRNEASPDLDIGPWANFYTDVHIAGDMLIAAHRNDNEVRIWTDLADKLAAADSTPNPAPDVTLTKANVFGTDNLSEPYGVWSDGEKLVVADSGNNRVLVWNSIPTGNTETASAVIGQSDFYGTTAGTTRSTLSLNGQGGYVTVDAAGKLFVSDYGNNRVLVFNEIPTSIGAEADAVIGQSDFTTDTTGTFNQPTGIAVDQTGSLWVANRGSQEIHRFD